MIDHRLEELKRRLAADPKNSQLQCELLNARARVEGAAVYLEALDDRLIWNECPELVQDLAIGEVATRLGAAYEWQESQLYSCGGQSHRTATFEHTKTGILLNLIPGSEFIMGDDSSEYENERPAHKVTIKPMLIGRFPVTQTQWQKIPENNPSEFKGLDNPVEQVSWEDCQNWLKNAGDGLRLPSESEWEYACRGTGHPAGTQTQYFWGAEMDDSYCWYGKNSRDKTHAVTEHMNKANAFGLVDMSGNVWEWCQDNWVDSYNNGSRDSQPRSSNSSNRVVRGGGWVNDAGYCRSAIRLDDTPGGRYDNLGFRVSRTLP
jgi:formylglycine-generating enzyme required for sulfatase activity